MPHAILPIGTFDTHGNENVFIVVTGWILDGPVDRDARLRAHDTVSFNARFVDHGVALVQQVQKWQYQLPPEFASSTPQPPIFKTVHIPGSIHDHYIYSKPSDDIRCTIKHNPSDFYSQGGPRSVGDLMSKDIPLAQLQLTMSDDATIIGLTTPHVLCDGYGNKEIILALARILRGEEVAPLQLGDPFEPILNVQTPPDPPPYRRVFNMRQVVVVMACLIWDLIRARNIQNRELFFPKAEVDKLKEEAMDDLRKQYGEQPDIWVSSSDVLVAFCLKTPPNVLCATNMRRCLADALSKPYLHNGVCTVVTPPLPAVKNRLRWRMANADRATSDKKINCVYLWGNAVHPFPTPNCMALVADDPRGGIWMGGFFSEKVWLRKDGFGQFIKG
ncbi:hypothetical protein JB92DRAFT_3082640 [Gautieria morchelliformis]|nr:hypothetical protein JB92DRAFT_3082640 [Gautieria morchelliformis]